MGAGVGSWKGGEKGANVSASGMLYSLRFGWGQLLTGSGPCVLTASHSVETVPTLTVHQDKQNGCSKTGGMVGGGVQGQVSVN